MRVGITISTALASVAYLALASAQPAQATTVATIDGCYDCGVYDTPSLIFHNTSGGSLDNAAMVLRGYQGLNNGLVATVNLGNLSTGDTQFFWGSLPGVPGGTTPGNLTAYDYDDEWGQTTSSPDCVINPSLCSVVGNFSVTFTAFDTFLGQNVFSVFSPSSNHTGGFVGWEGLDPTGLSETAAFDVHNGTFSGTLAVIDVGTPPPVPLPGALPLFGSVVAGFGMITRWRKRRASLAVAG